MIPYHRFLITVMAMPVSQEHRLSLLRDHHCFGLSIEKLNFLSRDLSNQADMPSDIKSFWGKAEEGLILDYPKEWFYEFSIRQNVVDMYSSFVLGKKDADMQQVMDIAIRQPYVFTIIPLFLTEIIPERICEILNEKYTKNYTVSAIEKFYFYFAQFSSLTHASMQAYMSSAPSRLRYLMRIALNEPMFVLLDELDVETGVGLKEVSSKIMSRSMRHFNQLSKVNHHLAMKEARLWGKMALDAGKDFEKSKRGNVSDFLAEFQVSLVEAEQDIISHNEDIPSDFSEEDEE